MSLISSRGGSHNTLEDMVDALKKYSKIEISKQSLADKIDSSQAVEFLTICLKKFKEKKIDSFLDYIPPEGLAYFSKILLQDSTTIVSKEIWKVEFVGTIYTLRWQIELIFKFWKNICQIHALKGTRPKRIQVLVLSSLIQISIYTMVYKLFKDIVMLL